MSNPFVEKRNHLKFWEIFVRNSLRVATYAILLLVIMLIGNIFVKGIPVVFTTQAPFINVAFLTEMPETLYVIETTEGKIIQTDITGAAELKETLGEAGIRSEKLISYTGGGILGPMVGTIFLTVVAIIIALGLGIASAIYLSEYAKQGKFIQTIDLAILNLAGVPSIVFGLFGLGLFVLVAPVITDSEEVLTRDLATKKTTVEQIEREIIALTSLGVEQVAASGNRLEELKAGLAKAQEDLGNQENKMKGLRRSIFAFPIFPGIMISFQGWDSCVLAGAFTLAFVILPVVITASEECLKAVPQGFREVSLALGATPWQTIRKVVLPYAMPGILTSSILGIARVAGETAPIMFTAAVASKDRLPWGGPGNWTNPLTESVQAMPYHIYTISARIPQNEYTQRAQYGSVFVFLMMVLVLVFFSVLLRTYLRKKYQW